MNRRSHFGSARSTSAAPNSATIKSWTIGSRKYSETTNDVKFHRTPPAGEVIFDPRAPPLLLRAAQPYTLDPALHKRKKAKLSLSPSV